jgi:hypothetical protein
MPDNEIEDSDPFGDGGESEASNSNVENVQKNLSGMNEEQIAYSAVKNLIASQHQINMTVVEFMNGVSSLLHKRARDNKLNPDANSDQVDSELETRDDRKGYVNEEDLINYLGVDDKFMKRFRTWAKKLNMDEVLKDLDKKPSLMGKGGARRATAKSKTQDGSGYDS